MSPGCALAAAVVFGTGCSSTVVHLTALLSAPTTTVRLAVTPLSRGGEWAVLELDARPVDDRCPRLSAGVKASVDGQPAVVERGDGSLDFPFNRVNCSAPSAGRSALPVMKRGEVRTFVLEEDSTRFEASLRLLTVATDVPTPAPFPGPDQRWRFEWSGAPPESALLFGTQVETAAGDGGFDVLLPKWLPTNSAAPAMSLSFPVYAIEGCVGPRCACRAREQWDFSLDGGTAVLLRHKRWPPEDLMDP